VVVYVEPALSVLIITTGMTPVKPAKSVGTEVTVFVLTDPAAVAVDGAKVQLAVPHAYPEGQQPPPTLAAHVSHPEVQPAFGFVVVAAAPPVVVPPVVAVVVAWVAKVEAWFSALLIADAGIGAPTKSHAHCRGVKSRSLSSSLSHCACMQVIKSGRKLPADARHRHAISVTEQLSS
jgi:hypothetical protein